MYAVGMRSDLLGLPAVNADRRTISPSGATPAAESPAGRIAERGLRWAVCEMAPHLYRTWQTFLAVSLHMRAGGPTIGGPINRPLCG